ncbi:hypothetical protein G7Y89_g12952 [Cudoniella acicularis]|uniref:Uncharacterized protein n=1 Tax=Cudoniella acicularis TaxID=354080 RepID=A0A8H4VYP6_9HELO|nr:hypothetical protein G7Y89_g12952 [Cudoniella acicularis]
MTSYQAETTAQAFTAGHRSVTPVAGTWQHLVLFAGPREPGNGNSRGPDDPEGDDGDASDPALVSEAVRKRFPGISTQEKLN